MVSENGLKTGFRKMFTRWFYKIVFQMVLQNGFRKWCFKMVLQNGLQHGFTKWFYKMVSQNGFTNWYYPGIL